MQKCKFTRKNGKGVQNIIPFPNLVGGWNESLVQNFISGKEPLKTVLNFTRLDPVQNIILCEQ
jgi:hypothetical protein